MCIKTALIKLTSENSHKGEEMTDLPEAGAFIIMVSDSTSVGTHSVFFACKTNGKAAVITRPITAIGATPELPTITWPNGSRPYLKYLVSPQDEEERTYIVNIIGGLDRENGLGSPTR